MEKVYKCIKEFSVDLYDEYENLLENECKIITIGSEWERCEFASLSDVRLDSLEDGSWLEIREDTLQEYFVEV